MTEGEQIEQAIRDAMQGLVVVEELLTDALDALWRVQQAGADVPRPASQEEDPS